MKGTQKGLVTPIRSIYRLFASTDPDAIIGAVFLLLLLAWAVIVVILII